MGDKNYWYIVKEDKYLTSGKRLTANFNLANIYDDEKEAAYIAQEINAEIVKLKLRQWVVVKDGKYLSYNEKFVDDMKQAYIFNYKKIAEQYAQEIRGQAIQIINK